MRTNAICLSLPVGSALQMLWGKYIKPYPEIHLYTMNITSLCKHFNLVFSGSEVIVSDVDLRGSETYLNEHITSSNKLRDYSLHTCETFAGYNKPFVYLWVYTVGTIGPLNVHVIGNSSCWPQMALHVMRVDSDGRMEYCSPRTEQDIQSHRYKTCVHYCRCKQCGNYIVIQLPVKDGTTMGAVCELSFGSMRWFYA